MKRLLVDIVIDPVCPWCYVGFRSFLVARDALREQIQILPRIRAYLLAPDTPAEGVDRQAYYEKKFPDKAKREAARNALIEAAAEAGLTFDPSTPIRLPNTLKAQQLIRLAHFDGAQEAVTEAIFDAYWRQNRDIGNVNELLDIIKDSGLDPEKARTNLEDKTARDQLLTEVHGAQQIGVQAVPTFIINETNAITGAYAPHLLEKYLSAAPDFGLTSN